MTQVKTQDPTKTLNPIDAIVIESFLLLAGEKKPTQLAPVDEPIWDAFFREQHLAEE